MASVLPWSSPYLRRMVRLVCIDVDGTLVGSSGAVHPRIWDAASRARDAGLRVAICSGRPAFGLARSYAERLDPSGWHIFQNGASVIHLPTGRSRSARLDADTVATLVGQARASGEELELYSDDDYAVERDSPRTRDHAALLGVPFRVQRFEKLRGPVVRAQWLMHVGEEGVAAGSVLDQLPPGLEISPSTSPVMPETLFVSLMVPGVDKGTAVRAVAGAHGVALEDVMFVGDGRNDAVAMQLVGYPVAMANAEAEARAAARHTVGHVDDGGLVEALELALALATA